MDLFEALHTQRAIRRFKRDPVPDAALRRVLDAAIQAPSGGNRQPWSFVVVRDPGLRQSVADYYRRAWEESDLRSMANHADASIARVYASATFLADHMGDVPVLILAGILRSGPSGSMTAGASIYPSVQNLMLAARGLGLGTVITTVHRRYETEIKELLSIPEGVDAAALIPLGVCPRIRSWRRKPPRNNLLTVIWTLSWSN